MSSEVAINFLEIRFSYDCLKRIAVEYSYYDWEIRDSTANLIGKQRPCNSPNWFNHDSLVTFQVYRDFLPDRELQAGDNILR